MKDIFSFFDKPKDLITIGADLPGVDPANIRYFLTGLRKDSRDFQEGFIPDDDDVPDVKGDAPTDPFAAGCCLQGCGHLGGEGGFQLPGGGDFTGQGEG